MWWEIELQGDEIEYLSTNFLTLFTSNLFAGRTNGFINAFLHDDRA